MLLLLQVGEDQPLPVPVQHVLRAGRRSAGRCPAPPAPAAGGPRRSGAGAQSGPPPPPGRRWSPGRRCSPRRRRPPGRSGRAISRRRISSCTSPMSWMWISRSCSFQTMWSWGSSSSSCRSCRSAVWTSHPSGQQHLIGEHRLQHRGLGVPASAQALARRWVWLRPVTAHTVPAGTSSAVWYLRPGVDADLVRLLFPDLVLAQAGPPVGQQALDPQTAPGDLQIGQPDPLGVPGDLVHLGAELRGTDRPGGVPLQPPEKLLHPLQLQGRAKPAGEQLPPGRQGGDLLIRSSSPGPDSRSGRPRRTWPRLPAGPPGPAPARNPRSPPPTAPAARPAVGPDPHPPGPFC